MTAQKEWYYLEVSRAVSIAGQVTDALTGAPIPRAQVDIIEGPPDFEARRSTLTGDPAWGRQMERLDRTSSRPDGLYLFMDLPPGSYRLRVRAPRPSSRYGVAETDPLTVWETRDPEGRGRLDSADIALSPTRVHGQVTRSDNNEPVSGAQVRLRGDTHVVLTDADGQYALTHLVAREPTIEAQAENLSPGRQSVELTPGQDHAVNLALDPA